MKSSQPNFYLPQLDALRFFAFFFVFLHHNLNIHARAQLTLIQETCSFGLCLFFFLSSYLITSLLQREKQAYGTINLKSFYVRRVLRIWPLYLLFLGACAVIGIWWPGSHVGWGRLAAMSLLGTNWLCIYAGMGSMAISPLWSISVEEQFYLVWPSLFRALPAAAFEGVAWGVAVASLVCTSVLSRHGAPALHLWLNTVSQGIFFAGGALFALRVPAFLEASWAKTAGFGTAGLLFWLSAEKYCHAKTGIPVAHPVLMAAGYGAIALGCVFLLAAFLYIPAARVPKTLVYLGKISYGLYVFHALVGTALGPRIPILARRVPGSTLLIELAVTILCAAASFEFIEKPFLRLKRRFEIVRTR